MSLPGDLLLSGEKYKRGQKIQQYNNDDDDDSDENNYVVDDDDEHDKDGKRVYHDTVSMMLVIVKMMMMVVVSWWGDKKWQKVVGRQNLKYTGCPTQPPANTNSITKLIIVLQCATWVSKEPTSTHPPPHNQHAKIAPMLSMWPMLPMPMCSMWPTT